MTLQAVANLNAINRQIREAHQVRKNERRMITRHSVGSSIGSILVRLAEDSGCIRYVGTLSEYVESCRVSS